MWACNPRTSWIESGNSPPDTHALFPKSPDVSQIPQTGHIMSSRPSYEYHRVTRGLGLRLVGTRTSHTTPLEAELNSTKTAITNVYSTIG